MFQKGLCKETDREKLDMLANSLAKIHRDYHDCLNKVTMELRHIAQLRHTIPNVNPLRGTFDFTVFKVILGSFGALVSDGL